MSEPDGALVDAERRLLLRCLALAGIVGTGFATGLIGTAEAADALGWPSAAFGQKDQAAALKSLGETAPEPSDKVVLTVPEIAENGAVVPVSVSTDLADVRFIAIMIPQNPFALTALYPIPAGTSTSVSCRVKMAQTAQVIALVAAGGKIFSAAHEVKVTLGGCG